METADVIAATKAEGENRARAEVTRMQIEGAVHLDPAGHLGRPSQSLCSAKTGEVVDGVWGHVEAFCWRASQAVSGMDEIVRHALESSWFGGETVRRRRAELVERLRAGRTTPRAAAHELLEALRAER